MKPKLQTVYTKINEEWDVRLTEYTLMDVDGEYLKNIKEQQLVTFTKEEFNTFLEQFGEEILQKAYKNADVIANSIFVADCHISEKSITEVLPDILNQYKL